MSLPFIAAADVEQRLSAADALEAALLPGLDPEADLPRGVLELGCSSWHPPLREILWPTRDRRRRARIQGVCVIFDGTTVAPIAVADRIAITNVRTAAVSAPAVRHLAVPDGDGWSRPSS
jgi:hypothetical protein